jgi:hypothetical protein
MSVAGTSFPLGTLKYDRPLRRRLVDYGLWTENLGYLADKPQGQPSLGDSNHIKIRQASHNAILLCVKFSDSVRSENSLSPVF